MDPRTDVSDKTFQDALVGAGGEEGGGEISLREDMVDYRYESPEGFFVRGVHQ